MNIRYIQYFTHEIMRLDLPPVMPDTIIVIGIETVFIFLGVGVGGKGSDTEQQNSSIQSKANWIA